MAEGEYPLFDDKMAAKVKEMATEEPKSLYSEVAKMLGVALGEEFKLTDKLVKSYVFRIVESGLEYKRDIDEYWRFGDFSLRRLGSLLRGLTCIVKLPYKPKCGETFWKPVIISSHNSCLVKNDKWDGVTYDLALLALGMVYRTKEEAEAHLAEDYKKLTGKELEE